MRCKSALVVAFALLCTPITLRAAEDTGTSIFDGKTLNGWDGDLEHWSVEDGAITGKAEKAKPLKHNTFIIWRQGDLDDFDLSLEYRIVGGNSGIQYRSFEAPEVGKWVVGGYQADFEAGDKWSGTLYGERFRDVLAARGQQTVIGEDHKPSVVGTVGESADLQSKIKNEDWNTYRVVARGYSFTHMINGQLMCNAVDEDKKMRRRSGILALQLHAGADMKVQFRNIRLKRLSLPEQKKIVLVAGARSHGYGDHEHNAGCLILAKALNDNVSGVFATVYRNGWPADPTAFDNADAIVFYCDGGDGHLVNKHLKEVDALMKKGVGLACIHYGVEVPKGEPGDRFLDWIGGYFEMNWSVNPHWTAEYKKLPEHPITRGVHPFEINDEWYYHMRFRDDMKGVTPILTAVPPASTLDRPDGTHSGNPAVRAEKGKPQHVAWACEREGGGRGFGFTGAHFHWNWGHPDFRKLVLNALVWVAKAEVPADGVPSKPLTLDDLLANQDQEKPADFDLGPIKKNLEAWNHRESAAAK